MKKSLALLPLLLLTACSPKPASVVDRYLKAVQSGDAEQVKMMCVSGEGVDKSLIQSAPAWTVVGEQQRSLPPYSYNVVTVKIVDKVFDVKVWKTDDSYKQHKASTDDLHSKGIEFNDVAYDRSHWSSEDYCVSVEAKP